MSESYNRVELENNVFFSLYATSKEITRKYNIALEDLNLTYTQYIVMSLLWKHGFYTMKELERKLYLDSGTLTPVLKALEKKGYIRRHRSFEDQRILIVTLTEEGDALKDKASLIGSPIDFTDEEYAQLQFLLQKALNDLYPF